MIAGIESLVVFLVFIALSGLSTWLQKKRQGQEDNEAWPTPPTTAPTAPPGERPQPRRSSPSMGWEEELRRLLGGDSQRPAPPPVNRPAPPPLRPAPARPVPVSRSGEEGDGMPSLARLEDSQAAYRRAQQLHAQAADQLRQAQEQTARKHRGGQRPAPVAGPGDLAAGRALVANARAARQAIIASVILGTPKGLE